MEDESMVLAVQRMGESLRSEVGEPGLDSGFSYDLAYRLSLITPDCLPAAAVRAARDRLLHAVGVSFSARTLPVTQVALASLSLGGGSGDCTVIGHRETAGATDATFVNGVIGHASFREDFGAGGHPGPYVIPAAIASAEERVTSGRLLLTAIIRGYEAARRMHAATPSSVAERGFRTLPTIGPFGAAAAASCVMNLSVREAGVALDLAANTAGGLYEGFWDGTMEPYLQAGFAARNGLVAANLAAAGARTATRSLEGRNGFFATFAGARGDTDALLGPYSRLAIIDARGKPYPACALNQDTILLITQHGRTPFSADEIERVVLTRPAHGPNGVYSPSVLGEPPYTSMLQAQMSAKFTAVAALLGRPVDQVDYYEKEFADLMVESVVRRSQVLVGDGESGIVVEVYLRDGNEVRIELAADAQIDWNRMSAADRFREHALGVLGSRKTQEFVQGVEQLESVSDIRELTRLLRP
jgi:2-methylcitrate dehydratase PrpD